MGSPGEEAWMDGKSMGGGLDGWGSQGRPWMEGSPEEEPRVDRESRRVLDEGVWEGAPDGWGVRGGAQADGESKGRSHG